MIVVPLSDRRPPECPRHPGARLRKLAGRAGREKDENWICFECKEIWNVAYIIRSQENRHRIEKEAVDRKTPLDKMLQAFVSTAMPGDVLVSRDFRAVYLVHSDGSRRRATDPEVVTAAVDFVKRELAKELVG